jgi:hypothetical protein
VATPCLGTRHEVGNAIGSEGMTIEDPRSIGQWVLCGDFAAFDRKPEGLGTNTNEGRSLGQIHPSFGGPLLA